MLRIRRRTTNGACLFISMANNKSDVVMFVAHEKHSHKYYEGEHGEIATVLMSCKLKHTQPL